MTGEPVAAPLPAQRSDPSRPPFRSASAEASAGLERLASLARHLLGAGSAHVRLLPATETPSYWSARE